MTDKEIIARIDRLDQIARSADGYFYYWPPDDNSCINAHMLRVIADELDRRNKEWNAQVDKAMNELTPSTDNSPPAQPPHDEAQSQIG
jgi:hypothetical protein